jgi:hypothetical protein
LWYKILKWKYGEVEGKIKVGGRSTSMWLRDIGRVEAVGVGNNYNWFEEQWYFEQGIKIALYGWMIPRNVTLLSQHTKS